MRLELLRLTDLRCFAQAEWAPTPGFNLITGANGSGKTTLLEAVHLLAHGRSFRGGGHAALTRREAAGYALFAQLHTQRRGRLRVGMGHDASGWQLRVNDVPERTLSAVVGLSASVCFEPGSHALLAGGSRGRRQYLDWGVFHVEPDFLPAWQRYQRALRQRNLLLRHGASDPELDAWEEPMVAAAVLLDAARRAYVATLEPRLRDELARLIPSLGAPQLRYGSGWAAGQDLREALVQARDADRRRGHSGIGPHRADWRLRFAAAPQHEQLSRGQAKLVALACMLAQARTYAESHAEWPIVCLDDLASELDRRHQALVVERLVAADAQVLVSGTEAPPALRDLEVAMFHVEQGSVHLAN